MSTGYLLDTSALAAHLTRQAGDRFVADCIRKGAALCTLSVFELAQSLKRRGLDPAATAEVWAGYRQAMVRICPVDEAVVDLAVQLRIQATARLPLAAACIAACAVRHHLILLHCDDHFAALSESVRAIDIRSVWERHRPAVPGQQTRLTDGREESGRS